MVPRAGRLRKEFEGNKLMPETMKITDNKMVRMGVHRKSATRVGDFSVPEKLLKPNQRIIFHRVNNLYFKKLIEI